MEWRKYEIAIELERMEMGWVGYFVFGTMEIVVKFLAFTLYNFSLEMQPQKKRTQKSEQNLLWRDENSCNLHIAQH